ncbi:hypothetical protein ACF0H5_011839 [Mactra antiquata]
MSNFYSINYCVKMRSDQEWIDAVLRSVKELNNFNYKDDNSTTGNVGFYINELKVGILVPEVIHELENYPDTFEFTRQDNKIVKVCLNKKHVSVEERSLAMKLVLDDLRQKDKFFTLRGWRNETYPIYYTFHESALLHMERSGCALFGVIQYGVHINGYTYKNGEMMMWIGRRSKTKQTYPNMLDNMCAGGLASGLGVTECAIKECQEEGSVDDESLTKLKPVGSVSYCFRDKRGILPEQQFVYDLEVSPSFIPKNADGEMQNFSLFTVKEIQDLIIAGEFKPNCAMVIINFLIRHGYMNADNCAHYPYIVEMMHKSLQPPM